MWFDDPHFDFDYHIRRIAVPAPGSIDQVAELVGDIAGRGLDRSRPLWEFWVIEGVEHDAVVVVARMHHATIDGVTGSSLVTSILDLEPNPAEPMPANDDFEVRTQTIRPGTGRTCAPLAVASPDTVGSGVGDPGPPARR